MIKATIYYDQNHITYTNGTIAPAELSLQSVHWRRQIKTFLIKRKYFMKPN